MNMEERNACVSQISVTRVKRIDRSREETCSHRSTERQHVRVVRAKSVSNDIDLHEIILFPAANKLNTRSITADSSKAGNITTAPSIIASGCHKSISEITLPTQSFG